VDFSKNIYFSRDW